MQAWLESEKEAFTSFDQDGNGKLTLLELKESGLFTDPSEVIEEDFAEHDGDSDGMVRCPFGLIVWRLAHLVTDYVNLRR